MTWGVCVGSTPLTYSICHHVTHLHFNYQHLSPRELPSFRFLYLLPPAVRVAGVCWSLSQLPQGKGKFPVRYRATMKDKPPLTLTNPTRENFANHRNFCLMWKLSVKKVPPLDNSGIPERRQITALGSTALIPHMSVASFE